MLFLILPAYNEAENIPELFSSIENTLKSSGIKDRMILFVNDGSTDGTTEAIEHIRQTHRGVLHLLKPRNEGLGAALQSGFDFLLKYLSDGPSENDVVITMDADNTHPAELIPTIISEIKNNGADIVIASRFVEGASERGVPLYRKILSRVARFIIRVGTGIKTSIRDFTSGYRGYSGKIILNAFHHYNNRGEKLITENDFAAGTELLFKLLFIGNAPHKVIEIPLPLRYDRKKGPSKIKFIRTIIGYFRVIFKTIPSHFKKNPV